MDEDTIDLIAQNVFLQAERDRLQDSVERLTIRCAKLEENCQTYRQRVGRLQSRISNHPWRT